jgi:hypothetical protein
MSFSSLGLFRLRELLRQEANKTIVRRDWKPIPEKGVFVNEFLLLAVIMIYGAIRF